MVDNAEVAGDQLVLQAGSVGNHDLVALVGDNDTGTCQTDALAEPDVTRDRQVVKLGDVGDRLETLFKVGDLLELVTEFDDGRAAELTRLVHAEHTMLKVVQLGLDQQEIGARLDGKETRTWDVDTNGTVKVLDSSADSGLELDDSLATVGDLVVDDDLEVERILVHNTLDGLEVAPCRQQGTLFGQ